MTAVSAVVLVFALLIVHPPCIFGSNDSMVAVETTNDEFEEIRIKQTKIGFNRTISQNTAREFAAHTWGLSEWSPQEFRDKMRQARRAFV